MQARLAVTLSAEEIKLTRQSVRNYSGLDVAGVTSLLSYIRSFKYD